MSAIEAQNRTGDFVVVSTDFIVSLEEDMAAGRVSAMSGGHEMDPTYSMLLCYNAITGGIAKEDLPVELIYPMVMVTDTSDVANYFKYFEGDIPALDADEIRALTKTYNPDFTLADLQESVAKISVADVMARHEGLFD